MSPVVMLTVDLADATSKQRETFYQELADRHWKKLSDVTTTWWARWKEEVRGLRDDRQLDRLRRQQPDRPTRAALRRRALRECDQPSFRLAVGT